MLGPMFRGTTLLTGALLFLSATGCSFQPPSVVQRSNGEPCRSAAECSSGVCGASGTCTAAPDPASVQAEADVLGPVQTDDRGRTHRGRVATIPVSHGALEVVR